MSTGSTSQHVTKISEAKVSEAVSPRPLTIALIRHEQPSTTPLSQSPHHHHHLHATPLSQASHHHHPLPVSAVVNKHDQYTSSSNQQSSSTSPVTGRHISHCSSSVSPSQSSTTTLLTQNGTHCSNTIGASNCVLGSSSHGSRISQQFGTPVFSQGIPQRSGSVISPSCMYGSNPACSSVSQSSTTPIPHRSSSASSPNCTSGSSPPLSASLLRRELVDIASKCQVMANQIDLFSGSSSYSASSCTTPPAEALALVEKNVQLTSEISELKTCKEDWKRRCCDLEHKLASLQDASHRPSGNNQEGINAVIKESKRQIDSLQSKLTETEVERDSLRKELSELHGMVSHMSAQLVTYKEDFENERRDRERAQGRIAELETQLIVAESRKPSSQLIGRGGGANHHHRNPLYSQGSIGYDMCDDIQCDGADVSPTTPFSTGAPNTSTLVKTSYATLDSASKLQCANNITRASCQRDSYETRPYFTNRKEASRASNNFDETDYLSPDSEKLGAAVDRKPDKVAGGIPGLNRVPAKGDLLPAVGCNENEQFHAGDALLEKVGGPNETDSSSASPLDINCKFFLGTPVDDVDLSSLRGRGLPEMSQSTSNPSGRGFSELNPSISTVNGRGLSKSNSNAGQLNERSVTNVDQKRLRKNLSDISCLRAVAEDITTCPYQSLQSSMYVQTSGEGSPARCRLRGISTGEGIIRTPSGSVESVLGTPVPDCQPQVGSKSASVHRGVTGSGFTGGTPGGIPGAALREEEEETLQCPKCRKLFRVEDHYLLMNHMEDVCM